METLTGEMGERLGFRSKIGYHKNISVKLYKNRLSTYINDNRDCWKTNTFDKTKAKSVWREALTLRDTVSKIEQTQQIYDILTFFLCLCVQHK